VGWEFSSLQGSLRKGNEEIVAPGYQGSGVKLLGDGSSHHYKDLSKRGKEARDVSVFSVWLFSLLLYCISYNNSQTLNSFII
jgi:hypothetical protein